LLLYIKKVGLKGVRALQQVYVLLVEDENNETIECRTFFRRDSANSMLENWAEENGISLNPDETNASVYYEEDESDGEEYISRIDDEHIGSCRIILSELED
jgi:hypothetical protein